MKKLFTFLGFLSISAVTFAQSFYPNNIPLFLNSVGDTLNSAFSGGLTSPQLMSMDINGDGNSDLLILDREGRKLLTYIRKGKGKYIHRPEYEYLFPELQNWATLVDYNRDGLMDIWAGNYSNVDVYKNIGTPAKPKFTKVVETILTFPDGVFQDFNVYSDGNNIPSVVDMDGDGDIDMACLNILGGYIDYYQNVQVDDNLPKDSIAFKFADACWGAMEIGWGNNAILGRVCLKNYRSSNRHYNSSFLHLDMDGDGDLELIHGDASYDNLIMMKNGKQEYSWKWDTIISYDSIFPRNTLPAKVHNWAGAFYLDYDNDGVKDLMVSPQDPRNSKNKDQILYYKNHGLNNKPDFQYVNNTELESQTIDLGSQSSPCFYDYDKDGDKDLLVASGGDMTKTWDSAYTLYVFKNSGTDTTPTYSLADTNLLGLASKKLRWLMPVFADIDKDGQADLLYGSNDGQLGFWKGNGPGLSDVSDFLDSLDFGNYAAPTIALVDGDTLPDLLIGRSNGTISYYRNTGGTNPLFTWIADSICMINVSDSFFDGNQYVKVSEGYAAPAVADFDNDGKPDLAVGALNGTLRVFSDYKNYIKSYPPEMDSVFYNYGSNRGEAKDFGSLTRPAVVDLDGDTYPDFMIGNSRGGLNFYGSVNQFPDSVKQITGLIRADYIYPTDYSFFPNPTHNALSILRSGITNAATIQLFDVWGRPLFAEHIEEGISQKSVDLSYLPKGIFIFRITESSGRTFAGKLVKE